MKTDIGSILTLTLTAAVIAVLTITALPSISGSAAPDPTETEPIKIIVDAGHGGFDGGAVAGDGTLEKDINLKIAAKLSCVLQSFGAEVVMTREGDGGLEAPEDETIRQKKVTDMRRRLQIMQDNGDAVFVSIHLNKYSTAGPKGTQVFYSVNREESQILAEFIQQRAKTLLQPENHRVIKKGTADTLLLHKAEIPAVIVECGFLSNPQELEMLKTDEYQTKMAVAIATGILDYIGSDV